MWATQEAQIIARLQQVLGAGVHVGAVRDLERVPQLRQRAPAAWVVYDGYTPAAVIGNGSPQQITQDWFVVITAKSARGAGDEAAARDEAAALCEQVLGALLGFHLGGGKFLRLAPAPGPEYDGGYCHVPLAFQSSATFKAAP